MHMNHQRLAAHLLGMNAGRIGEPVVRVNDVELLSAGNHTGYDRIVVDLFHEVVGIAPRKLDTTQVIGLQIIEICIDMTAKVEILLRVHAVAVALLHVIPTYIAPGDRGIGGPDYMSKSFILISVGFRYDKGDFNIATLGHAFGQAITGRAQTSQNMRGKFPTKH